MKANTQLTVGSAASSHVGRRDEGRTCKRPFLLGKIGHVHRSSKVSAVNRTGPYGAISLANDRDTGKIIRAASCLTQLDYFIIEVYAEIVAYGSLTT